jgi:hypothetical protein
VKPEPLSRVESRYAYGCDRVQALIDSRAKKVVDVAVIHKIGEMAVVRAKAASPVVFGGNNGEQFGEVTLAGALPNMDVHFQTKSLNSFFSGGVFVIRTHARSGISV